MPMYSVYSLKCSSQYVNRASGQIILFFLSDGVAGGSKNTMFSLIKIRYILLFIYHTHV